MGTMMRPDANLRTAAAELVELLDDKAFLACQTAEHWVKIYAAQYRVRLALDNQRDLLDHADAGLPYGGMSASEVQEEAARIERQDVVDAEIEGFLGPLEDRFQKEVRS